MNRAAKCILWFVLISILLTIQVLVLLPSVIADIIDRNIFERGMHPAECVVNKWFNRVFNALITQVDRLLETKTGDKSP
jgi:hypothetical protein